MKPDCFPVTINGGDNGLDFTPRPQWVIAMSDYHVSPLGTPTGAGTEADPLDLATALSVSSPAEPGDTIWLHGGTYSGNFTSALVGEPDAPIHVRQVAGERATISSSNSLVDVLTLNGSDVWLWDFEITNPDTERIFSGSGKGKRKNGVGVFGPGHRLIHLIIHDTGNGIGFWKTAERSEIAGCLIYYCGYQDVNGGHGHGIYAQNNGLPWRYIRDNAVFQCFKNNINGWGSSSAPVDHLVIEGNTVFEAGRMRDHAGSQDHRDIFCGRLSEITTRAVVRHNDVSTRS